MFTIEMDTENGHGTTITVLDETGQQDDLEVLLFDDVVFFRQVDDFEGVNLICLTNNQLKDMLCAMDLPSGTYRAKVK